MRTLDTHFEVIRDEKLRRPQEIQYVTEHVTISIYEVMLLQSIQHYGLCSVKETTDSVPNEEKKPNPYMYVCIYRKATCSSQPDHTHIQNLPVKNSFSTVGS